MSFGRISPLCPFPCRLYICSLGICPELCAFGAAGCAVTAVCAATAGCLMAFSMIFMSRVDMLLSCVPSVLRQMWDPATLEVLKTFKTNRPVNSAAISPIRDQVRKKEYRTNRAGDIYFLIIADHQSLGSQRNS